MKENMIKELVEMAMSSFVNCSLDHKRFFKKLEESNYSWDSIAEYVEKQVSSHEKFTRPCIFIDSDRFFGLKSCPFYKKLKPGDPHLSVCEGSWTADQRWNGGGPYVDETGKLITGEIPCACQGLYQSYFVQRVKKAIENYRL